MASDENGNDKNGNKENNNEEKSDIKLKKYLIKESEKVFRSLSPKSMLFSIRSLTERNTLKKELKWAKQPTENMPETEDEISVEKTIGGKAVLEKKIIFVPNIAEEPLFYPKGWEYAKAGYLTVTAFPIFNPEEEVIGVVQVYTEKNYILSKKEKEVLQSFCNTIAFPILIKKLQKKIAGTERFKLIGEHAASIAHHVRNKLTPIGGFAKRIEKMAKKTLRRVKYVERKSANPIFKSLMVRSAAYLGELLSYCEIISSEVAKLEITLKGIMDFNKSIGEKTPTDIVQFLSKIMDNFEREESSVKITREIKTNGIIKIAQPQLESVFVELFKNALDAAKHFKKERMEIICRIDDYKKKKCDSIKIEIENKGEIPENLKEKIFDPFITTKENGTGLGLPNAMAVIREHNGNIKIESSAGKTRVKIYLPR